MENINGIVVINKEKGFTSHDVVNVVRRIFSTRKVGHTGTLDPDATGVLPICIGKATKVADMLTFSDKSYVARVKLGITTDTQDITGEVLTTSEVNVTSLELTDAVQKFVGEIQQIPPMYSALKVNGKKLCDLARKGIEVERKPRQITVYSADVSNFDGCEFTLSVHCSKGTYIRTLCHDIGAILGCGAVMTELKRTKSSCFSLDNSYTLDELKSMDKNSLAAVLSPIDSVFMDYSELILNDKLKKLFCNGVKCTIGAKEGTYRVYDKAGSFLAVAEVVQKDNKNILKSVKTFY
ncbi:MAG: tRNA pseudouridine(55) synthase TruB [Clostridia bacterium]|nr:tRNA pseudouridine(55) synthase TruB [Clostridia bacterium]